jgi:hypothetical protein
MARRKSLERTHRGFDTRAFASAVTPSVCPICREMPVVAKGQKLHEVLEVHLMAQHRPDVACQRAHRSDANATWRLDFDAIVHGNPHIWFCSECGYYLKDD